MHMTADLVELIFLTAVALYLLSECWVTVRQILAAERSEASVPEGFAGRLTLAGHRKSAAFTTEDAQANLLLAFVAAGAALAMTRGGGLAVLAAAAETLARGTLLAQWLLLAGLTLLLLIIELPFGWLARFRIRERFGYMRLSRAEWLRRKIARSFAGWAASLPLAALALLACEAAGRRWWLHLWAAWLLFLFWRWRLSLARGRAWSRKSEPIRSKSLRALVADLLESQGFEMEDLVLMTRPSIWRHAHVLLVGTGRRRRVVVFAHAAARLSQRELLAVIATALGRVKLRHSPLRIAFQTAAGFGVAWLLGWGAEHAAFFEGLGLPAALSSDQPGTHAGYAVAVALVAFPILLFPLRPLVNLGSRRLQYAADRFAARAVGHEALASALVKLHRDYAQTLTPSRIYSLYHFARAHAAMRIARIRRDAARPSSGADIPAGRAERADAAAPAERTVLAEERLIRRRELARGPREPIALARERAEELERSLLKERALVVDDGFEDPAAELSGRDHPDAAGLDGGAPLAETLPDSEHQAAAEGPGTQTKETP